MTDTETVCYKIYLDFHRRVSLCLLHCTQKVIGSEYKRVYMALTWKAGFLPVGSPRRRTEKKKSTIYLSSNISYITYRNLASYVESLVNQSSVIYSKVIRSSFKVLGMIMTITKESLVRFLMSPFLSDTNQLKWQVQNDTTFLGSNFTSLQRLQSRSALHTTRNSCQSYP